MLPLVLGLLGAVPLVYEALVYAGLIHETYVRFSHPLWLLLCAASGLWLGWRLSRLPGRMTRTRRALVVVLSTVAAFAAALAVAEPEMGKPLDRLTVVVAVDRSRSIDLVADAEARVRAELK